MRKSATIHFLPSMDFLWNFTAGGFASSLSYFYKTYEEAMLPIYLEVILYILIGEDKTNVATYYEFVVLEDFAISLR